MAMIIGIILPIAQKPRKQKQEFLIIAWILILANIVNGKTSRDVCRAKIVLDVEKIATPPSSSTCAM